VTMFATDRSMPIAELARAVEERGFSSLWVPEHTHIPVSRRTPYPAGGPLPEEYRRTLDPFVALSMAAAVTTSLRVGTGIALVAQRDPIVTAKAVATLDHLSGGRFNFGVGYGWNADELEDHGVVAPERRAVVRERLLAMRALWSDEEASFDGEHVHLSPSWAWPKPVQQPGPPVLMGGAAGPTLLRHIAELGDGWIPIGGGGLAAALDDLRGACDDAGRNFHELSIIPFGAVPSEGKLEHYATLGVTESVLSLPSAGADEVLAVLDGYTRFLFR